MPWRNVRKIIPRWLKSPTAQWEIKWKVSCKITQACREGCGLDWSGQSLATMLSGRGFQGVRLWILSWINLFLPVMTPTPTVEWLLMWATKSSGRRPTATTSYLSSVNVSRCFVLQSDVCTWFLFILIAFVVFFISSLDKNLLHQECEYWKFRYTYWEMNVLHF